MNTQILIGLLLSALPFFELRVGLPIIVEYCVRTSSILWPYFILLIVLDIIVTFFIFISIDFIHKKFMLIKWYRDRIGKILLKIQIKAKKVEIRMDKWGYLALTFFVMIPLPVTGAWTGTLISWTLGLNRVKSFIAISVGIIISGSIVLIISLGVFNGIY